MHFISEFTQKAVVSVYETMLGLKVEPISTCEGSDIPSAAKIGVVGSVGFAGNIKGAVYMSYTNKLACSIAEKMFGETPSDVADPEVADVIGEMANMVAGDFKRQTSKLGYSGYLAPPLVMCGEDIKIDPTGADFISYLLFKFPELNEELSVRVFAKIENKSL